MSASRRIAASALLALACDAGETGALTIAPGTDGECTFGEEHLVAALVGGVDDLAMASAGDHALAVFSTRDGLFAVKLGSDARPAAEPRRLGPRCAAGVAASTSADGVVIACARSADPAAGKPGAILALSLDEELAVRWRTTIGTLGEASYGVAVAARDDGAAEAAWHDGALGGALASRVGQRSAIPRPLSEEGLRSGPPSVAMVGRGPVYAWAVTATSGEGITVGDIRVSDERGSVHRIASVLVEDARPVLVHDGSSLLVAYRDERPAGTRVALFVQRLDDRLETAGEAVRVGRSDAATGASVVACMSGLTTIAPHSYGRREALVGVHQLGADLGARTGELQIYTADVAYDHADGACVDGRTVVVAVERATAPDREARMVATSLECAAAR